MNFVSIFVLFGLLTGDVPGNSVPALQEAKKTEAKSAAKPAAKAQEKKAESSAAKPAAATSAQKQAPQDATKKKSETKQSPGKEDMNQPTAPTKNPPTTPQNKNAPTKNRQNQRPRPAAKTETKKGDASFDPKWTSELKWRQLGPANMGGRVVDLEVVATDPSTYYVVSASGGIFKTENNGTTFLPLFQNEKTISIGDMAIAPSDPKILWVGTGEQNARNSVSWGDGVYKSVDAGKTWTNMGLTKTFQIGSIQIHPTDPNTVYVGAIGRLWGPNEERGVFKTTDGGKTWSKALYVDAKTGCIDLLMSPGDPNVLFAAMYERLRDIYDSNDPIKRWGPGSGLYKSVDSGKTWKRLKNGLPTNQLGRIAITAYQKYPKVLYSLVETERVGQQGAQKKGPEKKTPNPGLLGTTVPEGVKVTSVREEGPAAKAGIAVGDIVVKANNAPVTKYVELFKLIFQQKPGDKLKLTIKRGSETLEKEISLGEVAENPDQTQPFAEMLGGQLPNIQDQQGDEGFQTGGLFKSTDNGENWVRVNSNNPRPFYFSKVYIDPSNDNIVYILGVSSFVSEDGGKTFKTINASIHSDHHTLWINPRDGRDILMGGDGGLYATHDRFKTTDHIDRIPMSQFYHVATDTRRPYRVYGGLQDNGSWGGPSMTRGQGPTIENWITVGGGDGFVCRVDQTNPDIVYCESQNGGMNRVNLKTGQSVSITPRGNAGRYRFNWNTPFILSSHNSRIFYCAGNFVHRSLNQGSEQKEISPSIVKTDKGTATALAESPVNGDVLYVGTDDGALWVTRNGGHTWKDLSEIVWKLTGGPRCVAAIEPSRIREGRVYVAIDGHRSNDDEPHIFVSENFGDTFTSIRGDLPQEVTRVIREDRVNPNLLYLGTEFSFYFSVDRGNKWIRGNNNLPTVAIHEFAQPSVAGDIVAATHGRGIWILNVSGLRQITDKDSQEPALLFRPEDAYQWPNEIGRQLFGHRRWNGDNPPDGTPISYLLRKKPTKFSLSITTLDGKLVRILRAKAEVGFATVQWDMRGQPRDRSNAGGGRGGGGGGGGGVLGALAQSVLPGQLVEPGMYRVNLVVDDKTLTQDFLIERDPDFTTGRRAGEETDDD